MGLNQSDMSHTPQQKQNIFITFVQCRPNVADVGPTLYKCHTNVSRLLGFGHSCCSDLHLTITSSSLHAIPS